MLRDAAINWVRTHCPNPRFQADFLRHLGEVIGLGVNCAFTVGSGLTTGSKPYLLHWFAGELFIFQLTDRQARKLGIAPKVFRFARSHESVRDGPPTSAVVALEHLEVIDCNSMDWNKPINLTCQYRLAGMPSAAYAFRLDFPHAIQGGQGSFSLFTYPPDRLGESGTIDLSFTPPQFKDGTLVNPVLPAFLRCTTVESRSSSAGVPISNAVATMLESGTQPFAANTGQRLR
jgi:hypothetical protein